MLLLDFGGFQQSLHSLACRGITGMSASVFAGPCPMSSVYLYPHVALSSVCFSVPKGHQSLD